MITIGVVMSNAYADYSAHMIRGLCRRAKEQESINLIFFPSVLASDFVHQEKGEITDFYQDAVSLVDVLIVSDQKMLQMLLEQPEGSMFSNVLEHVPYNFRITASRGESGTGGYITSVQGGFQ